MLLPDPGKSPSSRHCAIFYLCLEHLHIPVSPARPSPTCLPCLWLGTHFPLCAGSPEQLLENKTLQWQKSLAGDGQPCLPGEPCGKELCPLWRHLGNYQLPEPKKSLLRTCKFQLLLDLTTSAEGQQRRRTKWAPPPHSPCTETHSKLWEMLSGLLQQGEHNILLHAYSPKWQNHFIIFFPSLKIKPFEVNIQHENSKHRCLKSQQNHKQIETQDFISLTIGQSFIIAGTTNPISSNPHPEANCSQTPAWQHNSAHLRSRLCRHWNWSRLTAG